MSKKYPTKKLTALRVNQWHPNWEKVPIAEKEHRAEPPRCFYLFSMSAPMLQQLSGVNRRKATGRTGASEDLGIQRRHDRNRSNEIARFVKFGYPCSSMKENKIVSELNLRQPGWLPSAIIVNILTKTCSRGKHKVAPANLIKVNDDNAENMDNQITIEYPCEIADKKDSGLHPIEVIDGQHRLWAFEYASDVRDFELPVVAFFGLDLSWQAYLFYTINIKHKNINASLAYDLYPMLRSERWLQDYDTHAIYRETRAQELVDLLFSKPISPWYQRINMLGDPGYLGFRVTQASWIRSLLSTFMRKTTDRSNKIGGLFASKVSGKEQVLYWNRYEQAAFLMLFGITFCEEIKKRQEDWMLALRNKYQNILFGLQDEDEFEPAFHGNKNLINSDQGVRAILHTVNDLFYMLAKELRLSDLDSGLKDLSVSADSLETCINYIRKQKHIYIYLQKLSIVLASYDWRSSDGPGLTDEEKQYKAAFRGSGGYRALRLDILHFMTKCNDREIIVHAKRLLKYVD